MCLRVTDGVRALPEGSGKLHPAEGAGLEREGPPPAAVHHCLTLFAVLERAHHPLGEVLIWQKEKQIAATAPSQMSWNAVRVTWRDTVSRHLSHEDGCGLLETVVFWT